MKYTHRVVRISTDSNCGEHTNEALAIKRIGRLVGMSNGKLTRKDFRIDEIAVVDAGLITPRVALARAEMNAKATPRLVNKALKAAGIKAELVRNRSGYHYFTGDDVPSGISQSIMIYRTADQTVDQWVQEFRNLRA